MGCGGADRDDSFECILAPLSSTCSTAHAGEHNSVYHPRLPSFNQSNVGPVRTQYSSPRRRVPPVHVQRHPGSFACRVLVHRLRASAHKGWAALAPIAPAADGEIEAP